MIVGAHAIIYSKKAEADRAFLRDVIGMPSVDVGEGWLIFGMPPSEVAVHPAAKNGDHELYFIVEDVVAFVAAMKRRRIACTPPQDHGWGILTSVTLPGGGELGVYQPRHARPKAMKAKPAPARRRPAGKKATSRGTSKAVRRQAR